MYVRVYIIVKVSMCFIHIFCNIFLYLLYLLKIVWNKESFNFYFKIKNYFYSPIILCHLNRFNGIL